MGSQDDSAYEVDKEAPYYTTYQVVAAYDREAFAVDFWDQYADNEDMFPIVNNADLSYSFEGDDAVIKATDAAKTTVKEIRDVGRVDITKKIRIPQNLNNEYQTVAYDSQLAAGFPGYAQFKIERNAAVMTMNLNGSHTIMPILEPRILTEQHIFTQK